MNLFHLEYNLSYSDVLMKSNSKNRPILPKKYFKSIKTPTVYHIQSCEAMGNGQVQGCISNATQWPVIYVVKQDILQLQGSQYKTDFNAKAGLKGDVGNTLSLKSGQEKGKEKNQLKSGGKLEGSANVDYKSHTQGKIKRIQTQGKVKVFPNNSSRANLKLANTGDDRPHYISIWVQHPNGDIVLCDNVRIASQTDIRRCIWMDQEHHFKNTQIAKEPNNWRFAKGAGGAQYNYPDGKSCPGCHRRRCKPDCSQYELYGGYTE